MDGRDSDKPTGDGQYRRDGPGRDDPLAELERLAKKLAQLEIAIGRVADDMSLLIKRLVGWRPASDGQMFRLRRQADSAAEAEQVLKRQAEVGVLEVEIRRHADGSATVTIDRTPEIVLTATLADLLEALCEDTGQSSDEKVGWKTRDQLAERIKRVAGREFHSRNVPANIHRLRKALQAGGENRFLVQTNPVLGYRFAKLVKPGGLTGGEPG